MAATNRDLQRMVAEKQFRSDLFYRLNVFPIRIPPLRERPEDIPSLVHYFTQKHARRMEKQIETIPAAAITKLAQWHWPGNIRELENSVERAVILTRGTSLQLPVDEVKNGAAQPDIAVKSSSGERDEIVRILREVNGRVGGPDGAAARLGLKTHNADFAHEEARHQRFCSTRVVASTAVERFPLTLLILRLAQPKWPFKCSPKPEEPTLVQV